MKKWSFLFLCGFLGALAMSCSSPVATAPTVTLGDSAARSAGESPLTRVRLEVAEPYMDASNNPQISFRVHTGADCYGGGTISKVSIFWWLPGEDWQSFPLTKTAAFNYDISTWTLWTGNYPHSTDHLVFYVQAVFSDGTTQTDTNGGEYYWVANAGCSSYTAYQNQGYVAGVVGGNVGLSDARLNDGVLTVTMWVEGSATPSGVVRDEGKGVVLPAHHYKTYGCSSNISTWQVSFPLNLTSGYCAFYVYTCVGDTSYSDDCFVREFRIPYNGSVIR